MHNNMIKTGLFTAIFAVSGALQAAVPAGISAHFGDAAIVENRISLQAPELAEEGSVVPVTIKAVDLGESDLHITEVSFFNEKNATCPISRFQMTPAMLGEGLATRIRLADTTNVHVVARLSDGSVIGGQKTIKVTKGGCGGGSLIPSGASGPNNYCQQKNLQ